MLTLSPRRTTSDSLVVSPSRRQKTPSPQKLILKGVFSPSKASRLELKLRGSGEAPGQVTSVDIHHAQSGMAENQSRENVSPSLSSSPMLQSHFIACVRSNLYFRPSMFGHLPFHFLWRHRTLEISSSLSH